MAFSSVTEVVSLAPPRTLAAEQRLGEARRPAVALERELGAVVDVDLDPAPLERPPHAGHAVDHDDDARAYGEDVAAHGQVVVAVDRDPLRPALTQVLQQSHGCERLEDDAQSRGYAGEEGLQVQDHAGPLVVRQIV